MSETNYRLGIDEIRRFLPHRAPFLLVDRILEIHPVGDLMDLSSEGKVGVKVVGLKNITYNEPQFQGHFPQFSIMPGVLLIEAMAQVASFSLYPYMLHDLERISRDFQCILVAVDSARFRKPVIPGDSVRMESVVVKTRGRLWAFQVTATVDGQKVAEVELMANLIANSNPISGAK